jgi:hypothetical protein
MYMFQKHARAVVEQLLGKCDRSHQISQRTARFKVWKTITLSSGLTTNFTSKRELDSSNTVGASVQLTEDFRFAV